MRRPPDVMMPDKPLEILVLEPDARAAAAIAEAIPSRSTRKFLGTVAEVEAFLESGQPSLFLCADDLPGESGLMFLARTQKKWPGMKRVLMAPDLDGELFFHAMREVQIFSYLNKPVEKGELVRTLHHAAAEGRSAEPPLTSPAERLPRQLSPPARLALVAAAVVLGSAIVLLLLFCAFVVFYQAKSVAGIDLDPNSHLGDLFKR